MSLHQQLISWKCLIHNASSRKISVRLCEVDFLLSGGKHIRFYESASELFIKKFPANINLLVQVQQ